MYAPLWRNLFEFIFVLRVHLGPQRRRQDELANVTRESATRQLVQLHTGYPIHDYSPSQKCIEGEVRYKNAVQKLGNPRQHEEEEE
jgi:hypothetical protein